MNKVLETTCGAASPKTPFEKSFPAFGLKEMLGILAIIIAGFGLVALKPEFLGDNSLSSVMKLSSNVFVNEALSEQEKFDIKELVDKSMNYSYTDTQLGFYLENLSFFDAHSKVDAEKKILNGLPGYLSRRALNYVRAVLKIAEAHQVDPVWVLSVMWTESHFDYSAKSWAGARGLMQIMPATRKFVYKVYRSQGHRLLVEEKGFNIDEYFRYKVKQADRQSHIKKLINIELGVVYLKSLLKSFNSHKYATVAYNMGPGWTRGRLRRNQPVGQKNEYLDKVRKAYKDIVRKI
jgi:soluble lytic murein transglycosylase